MSHAYLSLARTVAHLKSLPRAKATASRHSYLRLGAPALSLVPQTLEARPRPQDAEVFETDHDEAKRVAGLLALLFERVALKEPALDAAMRAKLGLTDDDIAAIAARIGRDRAGEIMGLTWTGAEFIPDPNAEKAITTTTEKAVTDAVDKVVAPLEPGDTWAPGQGPGDTIGQAPDTTASDLALAIAGLYAFSATRPDVVTDYESGALQNSLALMAYDAAGVTQVLVSDNHQPNSCDICILTDGQVWTIEQAMANVLEHLHCVRTFSPLGLEALGQAASAQRLSHIDQGRHVTGRWVPGAKGDRAREIESAHSSAQVVALKRLNVSLQAGDDSALSTFHREMTQARAECDAAHVINGTEHASVPLEVS